MSTVKRIALTLVVIGAINWGLIGFFRFDLVAAIFGGQTAGLSRFIYILVGISGLITLSIFNDINEEEALDDHIQSSDVSYGTEFAEEEDIFKQDDDDDDLRRI